MYKPKSNAVPIFECNGEAALDYIDDLSKGIIETAKRVWLADSGSPEGLPALAEIVKYRFREKLLFPGIKLDEVDLGFSSINTKRTANYDNDSYLEKQAWLKCHTFGYIETLGFVTYKNAKFGV